GLRTRAPRSSRKVSAVLARADSEVPSNRSKGVRSTSRVSVCESSCVIGALDHPPPLRGETSFSAWIIQKVTFLRDKDWPQVVKTTHFPPHYLTLGGPLQREACERASQANQRSR